VPAVSWSVTESRDDIVGGKPVLFRKLVGHVDNAEYPLVNVDIEAELTIPRGARGVPVIVEFFPFEFRGRFPAPPSPTWQEQVIARGGRRSRPAHPGRHLAVSPGHHRSRQQGGRASPSWRARAWAWGHPACSITSKRIRKWTRNVPSSKASRFGGPLVTMAYERYAIGFIGSSGAGALARRNWAKKLENVAGGEYHWMAGNSSSTRRTHGSSDSVDAHELIALAAPRPLLSARYVEQAMAGSIRRACSWPPPPRAPSIGC
jgi:hypothetical protein